VAQVTDFPPVRFSYGSFARFLDSALLTDIPLLTEHAPTNSTNRFAASALLKKYFKNRGVIGRRKTP
jgi:hypothetical protein